MGFRDGKLGDLFVKELLEQCLSEKYGFERGIDISIDANVLKLGFGFEDVSQFRKDHCLKTFSYEYGLLHLNCVHEFKMNAEYMIGVLIRWLRGK
jgi:hypothetical protein